MLTHFRPTGVALCALSLFTPLLSAQDQEASGEVFTAHREFADQEVAARRRYKTALEFEAWRKGHMARAWKAAKPHLEAKLAPDAHFFLAGLLMMAERYEQADRQLTTYLQGTPTRLLHALSNRIQVRMRAGRWDGVIEDLQRVEREYSNQLSFSLFQFAMPALQLAKHREYGHRILEILARRYRGDENYEKVVADFTGQFRWLGTKRPWPKPDDVVGTWPSGYDDDASKLTLIVFARTSIPHCRRILPFLSELRRKYHDRGLTVVLMTVFEGHKFWKRFRQPGDATSHEVELAGLEHMSRELELEFPIGVDRGEKIEPAWNVEWQPHAVLCDRHGDMLAFWSGGTHFEWLDHRIRQILVGR